MTPTLFQRALKRELLPTPPVWMMRQAGRYHRHYQNLRSRHSFMDLCKDSELAAAVALGPIEDFDFDVAILFSDLLFPLEALGMPLEYSPGPVLGWHLENSSQFANFRSTETALQRLEFQAEAMLKTRARLPASKSLIGFVGGPWTLFTYAVEGSHHGGLITSLQRSALFEQFCEHMVPLLQKNIELQLNAGADIVMIFDTSAGEAAPDFYAGTVVPALARLARPDVGYYLKGGTLDHYHAIAHLPFAGMGYDHRFSMSDRLQNSTRGFVQGNFHQSWLTVDDAEFDAALAAYFTPIRAMPLAQRAGWVAGLGHGVIPQARERNVRQFVETLRDTFK